MANVFKLNPKGSRFSLIGSGDTIFIKPIKNENKLLIEFFLDDNKETLEAGTVLINYGDEIAISEADAIEVLQPTPETES